MKNLGYYNGKFGPLEEMTVPFLDRVSFYGDGVYDATYAINHKIFAMEDHMERFFNSARLLKFDLPWTKEELAAILDEMVQKVDSNCQFVYWQITRGTAMRKHKFPVNTPVNLWIYLVDAPLTDLSQRYNLITVKDTRFLHCNIKTLNLIPAVMAAQKAEEAGCEEVIFYRGDNGERVTECAHSNCHIIKDNVFITAPADNLILPGIARKHIIQICKDLGYAVEERAYTVKELMEADEVIVSSSGTLGVGVDTVDGKPVGGKNPEMLKAIQEEYKKRVEAACGKYFE